VARDPSIEVRRARSDPATVIIENDDVNERAPPPIIIPTHPPPLSSIVLSNPSSLIRSIERLMHANAPYAFGRVRSVQGEAIRWSCGLIRNLTRAHRGVGGANATGGRGLASSTTGEDDDDDDDGAEGICSLISRTDIPHLVVRFVDDSPRPIVEWTRDSTEDACLGAMCNMAVWRDSLEALRRAGASRRLRRLEGQPGIHGYRARAIRCGLGALSPLRFDHRAVSSPL
jgi:hypothetical protein